MLIDPVVAVAVCPPHHPCSESKKMRPPMSPMPPYRCWSASPSSPTPRRSCLPILLALWIATLDVITSRPCRALGFGSYPTVTPTRAVPVQRMRTGENDGIVGVVASAAARYSSSGRRVWMTSSAGGGDDDEGEDDDDDDDDHSASPSSLGDDGTNSSRDWRAFRDALDGGGGHRGSSSASSSFHSFGLRGRSAPSQRKAMGRSTSNSPATVNVCTNCGSEFVKWVGRCPTCKEWNTVQEFRVNRGPSSPLRPSFGVGGGRGGGGKVNDGSSFPGVGGGPGGGAITKSSSWLGGSSGGGLAVGGMRTFPVRLADIHREMMSATDGGGGGKGDTDSYSAIRERERRLVVPRDEELNNVLGGGLMPGSLTLLGGDPGVGKSTLLLQTAASVASLSTPPRGIGMGMDDDDDAKVRVGPVLYVSGEENTWQIASRAARLGIVDERASGLVLLCDTDADSVAETVVSMSTTSMSTNAQPERPEEGGGTVTPPSLVVIDSIQTMVCDAGGDSAPGGVTQVRETVGLFLRLAKGTGIPVILIGHVTKTGDVAGPRTVEHMVDCVLYLEGDRTGGANNVRMLRASKNRFGSSDEVGVYEMSGGSDDGNVGGVCGGGALIPVSDPSSFFLSTRMDTDDSEGCAVSLVLEGSRCVTAEVQALVSPISFQGKNNFVGGRRTVEGIATSRLLLILAVLDKRFGIRFGRHDVFINVVGGIRLGKARDGSASDVAVAASLVSSLAGIPVRADTAFVGEVGLVGELRPVSAVGKRVAEARRMGFSRVVVPSTAQRRKTKRKRRGGIGGSQSSARMGRQGSSAVDGIEVVECENLLEAINAGLVKGLSHEKLRRKRSRSGKGNGSIAQGEEVFETDVEVTSRVENPLSLDDLLLDDDDDDEDSSVGVNGFN